MFPCARGVSSFVERWTLLEILITRCLSVLLTLEISMSFHGLWVHHRILNGFAIVCDIVLPDGIAWDQAFDVSVKPFLDVTFLFLAHIFVFPTLVPLVEFLSEVFCHRLMSLFKGWTTSNKMLMQLMTRLYSFYLCVTKHRI